MCKSSNTIATPVTTSSEIDPHTSFEPILAAVQSHARVILRFLACDDRKADVTAEAVGLAWLWHLRLCDKGRDGRLFPTAIATFALQAALSGRRVVGQDSCRDVMSPVARRRHGININRLPTHDDFVNDVVDDALTECSRSRVPEIAHVRVEFPRWVNRMSARNQRFVIRAAEGNSTSDLARIFQITKARVSQMRRELAVSWYAFCRS